jgi:hypothetical protein
MTTSKTIDDSEVEAIINSLDRDTRERYARRPSSAKADHAEAARVLHSRHVAAFEASAASREAQARERQRWPAGPV